MFHKIRSVTHLPGYTLLISFVEGVSKTYSISPLFSRFDAFQALKNTPGLFEQVQVDAGGYGVVWNDDLDISCDELWANGQAANTPFDHLLAFSDATSIWGLHESTLRKAISYGKLKGGVDVQKFGKQWVITAEAMHREYGNPHAAQGRPS